MEKTAKRILIVANEATLAYYLVYSFMAEGEGNECEATRAHDPDAALAKMKKRSFDLLVLDIYFPFPLKCKFEGFSLAKQVREKWPKTKVILMTEHGTPEVERRAKQVSYAYLERPFAYAKLRDLALSVLQESE